MKSALLTLARLTAAIGALLALSAVFSFQTVPFKGAGLAEAKIVNPGKTKLSKRDFQEPAISKYAEGSSDQAWFSESMPWDGKWGAFNRKESEAVLGTCALKKDEVANLDDLIARLETDEANLKKDKNKGKGKFSDFYRKRINGASGVEQADDRLAIKQGLRTYLPSKATSVDDFKRRVYSNSNVSGCDRLGTWERLAKFFNASRPQLSEMLFNPLTMMTALPTSVVSMASAGILTTVGKFGIPWTLSTPHTERGDLIFSTSTSAGRVDETPSCSSSPRQMGFDCGNLRNRASENRWWIDLAKGLRSSLSIIYGIVVMMVAIGYVYRRREGGMLDAKRVLPRVVASVILAAMAPYLIGMGISISNLTVKGILSIMPGDPMDQIASTVYSISTGRGSGVIGFMAQAAFAPIRQLGTALVMGFTAFTMTSLVIFAIVKQIALIVLVIATPVAIISIVVESWSDKIFSYWLRGLAAVLLLPVAQALVLVIGMTMAEVMGKAGAVGGAFVGTVIMVVAMRAMVKANSFARGMVTGKGSSYTVRRLTGKASQMAAPVAGMAANAAAPGSGVAVSAAMSGAGSALTSSADASKARSQKMASKATAMSTKLPGVSSNTPSVPSISGPVAEKRSMFGAIAGGAQSGASSFKERQAAKDTGDEPDLKGSGQPEDDILDHYQANKAAALTGPASEGDLSQPKTVQTDSGERVDTRQPGDRGRSSGGGMPPRTHDPSDPYDKANWNSPAATPAPSPAPSVTPAPAPTAPPAGPNPPAAPPTGAPAAGAAIPGGLSGFKQNSAGLHIPPGHSGSGHKEHHPKPPERIPPPTKDAPPASE